MTTMSWFHGVVGASLLVTAVVVLALSKALKTSCTTSWSSKVVATYM